MSFRRFWPFLGAIAICASTATLSASSSSADTDYHVLYNFSGGNDGGNAATRLIFDQQGNAYGTTVTGGIYNCGTVFKLKPTGHGQWQESMLYSFTCLGDGKNPHGGLTFDGNGNLIGTTVAGGSGGICTGDGCGVVFELTPSGESVLYNFTGGNDGFGPGGPVIIDASGNIFGETPDGGASSAGTVFELKMRNGTWHEHVIHAFTGGADGGVGSLGPLLMDTAGKLYGVTEIGGAHSAGTAFRLAPRMNGTWVMTTLYTFNGQPDAGFPYGGLISDAAGNLYGTTYFGGTNGAGAVYELTPRRGGWTEKVLYSFAGGNDGSLPTSTLIFDAAGNLYGTTTTGGHPGCDCGTIFKLKPNPWREVILHRFGNGGDGTNPLYALASNGSRSLFGATPAGGLNAQGVIFEISP
jgi:uncharacterized repeat protein (TIGR03803 family)